MEAILSSLYVVGAILFMVFFFGFCVFIHELGHFLVAKWRGLHIVAFSIGFKKAWGFTRGGVEYRVGWIPCGGYVDLPQIDSSEEKKIVDGKELPPIKPVDRILCAAAGPLFNVLFGLFLGLFIWHYGIPQDSPRMREIVVESVEQGSPEYNAGLRAGDVIVKVNGSNINTTWMGFVKEVLFTVGKVNITVKRGNMVQKMAYTPVENPNHFGRERLGYPFFTPRIPVILYPKKDSPASQAGVKRGDILIKVDGKKVGGVDGVSMIGEMMSKSALSLTVLRGKEEVQIPKIVPLATRIPDTYRIGIMRNPDSLEKVDKVLSGSPAAKAGILAGDVVVAIDGKKLASPADLQTVISAGKGREVAVTLLRNNKEIVLKMTPEPAFIYDLGLELVTLNHPNPVQLLCDVVMMSFNSVRGVAYGLANKAGVTDQTSTLKPRHFSGPLGIAKMIYQSVYYGSLIQGLYLIVIITFSLGILNILPLPVLDGGHIMLATIELVIGRPLPSRLLQPVNTAFVIFLISFMLYVSFYDVIRFMPEKKQPAATAPAAPSAQTTAVPDSALTVDKKNPPVPKFSSDSAVPAGAAK